jgi:hypothetical protein
MLIREKKRVCYIQSRPEWFSYAVLRLFYRDPHWLFVPLLDLSSAEREIEYKKAKYFFISGYGYADEAKQAYESGCILVGVRADVPIKISVEESKQWDPFSAFALINFYGQINLFPKILKGLAKWLFIFYSRMYWYLHFAYTILAKENWQNLIIKAKKFFYQ